MESSKNCSTSGCCKTHGCTWVGAVFLLIATILTVLYPNGLGILGLFVVGLVFVFHKSCSWKSCCCSSSCSNSSCDWNDKDHEAVIVEKKPSTKKSKA